MGYLLAQCHQRGRLQPRLRWPGLYFLGCARAIPSPGWVPMGVSRPYTDAPTACVRGSWSIPQALPMRCSRCALSLKRRAVSVADDTRARGETRRACYAGLWPHGARAIVAGCLCLFDDIAAVSCAVGDALRRGMHARHCTTRRVLRALSCSCDSRSAMRLATMVARVGERPETVLDDCLTYTAYAENNYFPLLWRFYTSHRQTLFGLLDHLPWSRPVKTPPSKRPWPSCERIARVNGIGWSCRPLRSIWTGSPTNGGPW